MKPGSFFRRGHLRVVVSSCLVNQQRVKVRRCGGVGDGREAIEMTQKSIVKINRERRKENARHMRVKLEIAIVMMVMIGGICIRHS
jgi:hypothetical protein